MNLKLWISYILNRFSQLYLDLFINLYIHTLHEPEIIVSHKEMLISYHHKSLKWIVCKDVREQEREQYCIQIHP